MNPFSISKVDSPRRVGTIVESLNREALESVLATFKEIELPAPHPPTRAPKIVQIVSSQAGTGKSHLLGRLFKSISSRATRIYLLPFQDSNTAWASVLDAIVDELRRPEILDKEDLTSPDQLDAFAHGVFGHALAELIKKGQSSIDGMDDGISVLQNGISSEWDLTNNDLPLTQAFHQKYQELEIYLEQQIESLQRDQPVTIRSIDALLKILYAYASSRDNFRRRKACYMWLNGTPYQDKEIYSSIGLNSHDLVNPNLDSSAMEQSSRQRVVDFAILASFYRPFLFCFDQTEYFAKNDQLSACFGEVLDFLHVYTPNHCTVFTSNQTVWERIQTHIEKAYLDVIATPIDLKGLNRSQGEDLIHLRMEGEEESKKLHILNDSWLSETFDSGHINSRVFLKNCEERYDGSTSSSPTLQALFEKRIDEASRNAQAILAFNTDILKWASESLFPVLLENCSCERTNIQMYPLRWVISNQTVALGFEGGNHHSRWTNLLTNAPAGSKTLFFRTPDCKKIPGNWKNADKFADKSDDFLIHTLEFNDLSIIHAARQMEFDSCDGSVEFSTDEIIQEASAKLSDLELTLNSLLLNTKTPETTQDLTPFILAVVRERLFLSLSALQEAVEELANQASISEEEIINQCHHINEVEIHSSGSQVLLHYIE